MPVHPKEEQEAIIRYDRQLNEWYYYSDVPMLNKKWKHLIELEREIAEENGDITLLAGKVVGNVSIRKKRVDNMTEQQRKEASTRMKLLNESKLTF